MSTPNWLIFRITTRQRYILLLVALVYAGTPASNSLLPPFLPEEAGPRGISVSMQGWILGMCSLAQAILAPLFGGLISRFGCRNLIVSGSLCLGVFSVIFGALTFMPLEWDNNSGTLFAVLGIFLRFVSGVGAAAALPASLAVVARYFPDDRTTILTACEGMFGAGVAIGPALGGLFYQIGGFFLPFIVFGVLLLLSAVLAMFTVPADKDCTEKEPNKSDPPVKMMTFLLDPRSVIMFTAIVISGFNFTLLGPILETHLKPAGLLPYQVGILFALIMVGYTVTSLIISPFIARAPESKYIMVVGFAIMMISCCAIGPSPIFNVDPGYRNVWMITVMMPIYGAGMSLSLVPTFHQFLDLLSKWNLPNSEETFGVITGLWTSFATLGGSFGSILSGIFYSRLQFQGDLAVFSLMNLIMIAVLLLLVLYERYGNPHWKRNVVLCDKMDDEAEMDHHDITHKGEKQLLLSATDY